MANTLNFEKTDHGLAVHRLFTTEGTNPLDSVEWTKSRATIRNGDKVIFDQENVEHPTFWKPNNVNVCATHYLRGRLGTPEREVSFKQAFHRVATVIASWGYPYHPSEVPKSPLDGVTPVRYAGMRVESSDKTFESLRLADGSYKTIESTTPRLFASPEDRDVFRDELLYLLTNGLMAFNSPVWYNVGIKEHPQCSACFILSLEDSMDSIRSWIARESFIFQGGSGSGLNVSNLRGSMESIRGTSNSSSGPLQFMRWADAGAGAIRSGGATRRAAKMVVMDVDHPDIVSFVEAKKKVEDMGRALIRSGHEGGINGEVFANLPYQNANQSVRVTNEFMEAAKNDDWFPLIARTDNFKAVENYWPYMEGVDTAESIHSTYTGPHKPRVVQYIRAKWLWHKINECAWDCADPGLQFHDTINEWHTAAGYEDIRASNPCSEYMYLDDTSCNLASINVLALLRLASMDMDEEKFEAAIRLTITAQELLISNSSYPSVEIDKLTRATRSLGIGFANLGAAIMSMGYAYDSDEGRNFAAACTSMLTGIGYEQSAMMAKILGPYELFKNESVVRTSHKNVLVKHAAACNKLINKLLGKKDGNSNKSMLAKGRDAFLSASKECDNGGLRNSQISVMAPTGTISFLMQCDTTGMEPAIGLTTVKSFVGGERVVQTVDCVRQALKSWLIRNNDLPKQVFEVEGPLDTFCELAALGQVNLAVSGFVSQVFGSGIRSSIMEKIKDELEQVFMCSIDNKDGKSIKPEGHVKMMAAMQPFISGAISKTVNLPASATVEDIANIHMDAWTLGVKAIAVYRDQCKIVQPVETTHTKKSPEVVDLAGLIDGQEFDIIPVRRPLPDVNNNTSRIKVRCGEFSFYVHVGRYEDGNIGEVFFTSKEGSTIGGLMGALGRVMSIALQYGTPIEPLLETLAYARFEPSGFTGHSIVRIASSVVDAFARILAAEEDIQLPGGDWSTIGGNVDEQSSIDEKLKEISNVTKKKTVHDKICSSCGSSSMRKTGSCYTCNDCGDTTGCG